jgi:hypothetical protein
MKKFFLSSFLGLGLGIMSYAQTSVFVCTTNGSYGFCFGDNKVADCAYQKCISSGGKTPFSILLSSSKGYGAIAVGKNSEGGQVVMASAGYKKLKDAEDRAYQECANAGGKNITIAYKFEDK